MLFNAKYAPLAVFVLAQGACSSDGSNEPTDASTTSAATTAGGGSGAVVGGAGGSAGTDTSSTTAGSVGGSSTDGGGGDESSTTAAQATTGGAGGGGGGTTSGGAGGSSSSFGEEGQWVLIERLSQSTLPDVHPIKLVDGSVLLVGGFGSDQVFRYTTEDDRLALMTSLPEPRGNFGAVLLEDGQVLVLGGNDPDVRDGMTTCLLYDPDSDSWSETGALPEPRYEQVALLLPDGNVLAIGGAGPGVGGTPSSDVYLYDVVEGTWEAMPALTQPARQHWAFLQDSDRAFVAAATSQIYDLTTQSVVLSAAFTPYREAFAAVQLLGGSVLAIGGRPASIADATPVAHVDEFEPAASAWANRAALPDPRYNHMAVTLADDTVLVAGGASTFENVEADPTPETAVRFVPSRDSWRAEAAMPARIGGGHALLLDDGSALFVGGDVLRFHPVGWQ